MNSGLPDRDDQPVAIPWEPQHSLRECDAAEVFFSRGFLRSHPERWFPGFSAFWLPLAHSLGVEVNLVEVKPLLIVPGSLEHGFSARIDGEVIGILFDQASARVISESVAPGCEGDAERIALEYMMRRFVHAASVSWSAVESSQIEFDASIDPFQMNWQGAVKLTVMVNNNYATIWTALGVELLKRLDGLWRRQMHAQAKSDAESGVAHIEITQLSVPPTDFVDFTTSGAVIDLEIPSSDTVTLRLNGKVWLPARVALTNSEFALESLPGAASNIEIPEGTTRLSIELGRFEVDGQAISELSQAGAFLQTGIPAGNRVSLVAQEREIAQGTLCVYEGRFAVVID